MAVVPKIFTKRFTAAYLKSSQLLSQISTDTAGSSWLIYQGELCWWEREWNMSLSLKSILACCSDKHAVFIFFLLLRLNALTKSKLGRGSGESLFGLCTYHWGKSGQESGGRTWTQAMMEHYSLAHSPSFIQLVFLQTAEAQGWYCFQWTGPPTSTLNQEMPFRLT